MLRRRDRGSAARLPAYLLAGIMRPNWLPTTLNTATRLATDLDKGAQARGGAADARYRPLAGHVVADLAGGLGTRPAPRGRRGHRLPRGHEPARRARRHGPRAGGTPPSPGPRSRSGTWSATPEKLQLFGFVLLFPLTFTSGAYVKTASMPGWLQAVPGRTR